MVRGHAARRRGETQCALVTGFAGRPGGDVICRLAESLYAIMAGWASRCNAGMVEGCAREARKICMASLALTACRYMARWLPGRQRPVMAGGTGAGRSFETAVNVAAYTVNIHVSAGEREPRTGVIKPRGCALLGEGGMRKNNDQREDRANRE